VTHKRASQFTIGDRPAILTFAPKNQVPKQDPTQAEFEEEILRHWRASSAEFRAEMTFAGYSDIRIKNRPRRGGIPQNQELQKKASKMTLPFFDRSGKTTARAWVYKLDSYLQISPMPEEDAITYVALHLERVAHKWWSNRKVTLGHDQITSYVEFTTRLIDRFDTKDPELQFKELAQLRQSGSVDSYISKFQNLSVMVPDISECRLVILFIVGFSDPLHGWVKGFDPASL